MIRSCAWMVVVLALGGCSKGDGPPSRSEARKLAAGLQAAEEKRTEPPVVAEPPAAPPAPAPAASPSPVVRAELVSAFEADLRSNPRLSASERRQFAESLADDWIGLQQGLQDEEARNRAIGKAMEARYGTVEDIRRKECESQRMELAALEHMAKGPPGEIQTEQEKAERPAQIEALRSRIQQSCP